MAWIRATKGYAPDLIATVDWNPTVTTLSFLPTKANHGNGLPRGGAMDGAVKSGPTRTPPPPID
jgi:hypothetical protein